jgi:NAD(P)-dependent dehydrogenase (short-subunit alcohol dehydrogenase family)
MRPPMWLGVGRFQGNGQNRTADFAGVVVSDRYVSYWHAGWENVAGHQACLAHLLRDYQDAAETYPGAHGDQRPGHVAGDRVVAVTNAFLPALRRSAHPRIVNISSGTGSLAWATGPQFPHRGTYAAYRSSKAALNALTVYYAHALADDGIKVNALAPGLRRTDLNATAAASDGDPAEAAAGAVRLALLPDDGPSGEFFSWDGTQVPW